MTFDFAAAGRSGAALRVIAGTAPADLRRRDEDQVCALGRARLERGLPLEERRWSIEALAFWVRTDWPKPRGGFVPPQSTVERHIVRLMKARRLPPVAAWPE